MSVKERVKLNIKTHIKDSAGKIDLPLNVLVISKIANNDMVIRKINKKNINNVMKQLKPNLKYAVNDAVNLEKNINVHLEFNEIKDFRPERLAMQVPELRKLLGVRNMLKLMKDKSITNKNFLSEVFHSKCGGYDAS